MSAWERGRHIVMLNFICQLGEAVVSGIGQTLN